MQSTLPPAPNRLGMALGGALTAGSILSQGGIFGSTNTGGLFGGFGGGTATAGSNGVYYSTTISGAGKISSVLGNETTF